MSIEQIAVIGAGTMGNGIAQVCAIAGYQVLLVDVSDAALERGVATLSKNLERQVNKGTLDADKAAAAKARIRTSTDYTQLSTAHLVIEGSSVVLCHGDDLIDVVRRGQGVLNLLPLAQVKDQVDGQIIALFPEMAHLDRRAV